MTVFGTRCDLRAKFENDSKEYNITDIAFIPNDVKVGSVCIDKELNKSYKVTKINN